MRYEGHNVSNKLWGYENTWLWLWDRTYGDSSTVKLNAVKKQSQTHGRPKFDTMAFPFRKRREMLELRTEYQVGGGRSTFPIILGQTTTTTTTTTTATTNTTTTTTASIISMFCGWLGNVFCPDFHEPVGQAERSNETEFVICFRMPAITPPCSSQIRRRSL